MLKEINEDFSSIKKIQSALDDVPHWKEYRPVNQRVAGLIPSLGHMSGLWARSPVRDALEATTH